MALDVRESRERRDKNFAEKQKTVRKRQNFGSETAVFNGEFSFFWPRKNQLLGIVIVIVVIGLSSIPIVMLLLTPMQIEIVRSPSESCVDYAIQNYWSSEGARDLGAKLQLCAL